VDHNNIRAAAAKWGRAITTGDTESWSYDNHAAKSKFTMAVDRWP